MEKERRKNRELAAEVSRVEERIKYLEERTKAYERGYGIEDAAAEIEKWRQDAVDRDKALGEGTESGGGVDWA